MLTLRLQRSGKKNRPEFRVVLAQKTAAAGKKFLEVLGNYNPRTKDFVVKSEERLKYWIAQHVEISPTLHNLLVSKNLLDSKKTKAFGIPTKVKAKREEAEAKAKAEAEAKAQAEADAVAKASEESATMASEAPAESSPETPEQPAA